MKKTAFLGASVLALGSLGLSGVFMPANAFTFSGGSVTGITADDIGKYFDVNFDGNVSTNPVEGLTSTARFKLTEFNGLSALFDVDLTNTSSAPIGSRVSVIGFDVTPDISGATSVGDFNITVLDSALPNQFGNIGVCVKGGGGGANCQGGGGAGASTGESLGFNLALNWSNQLDSFDLSNFGVRYQSITGTTFGTSGTGRGTPQKPEEPPTQVPEPAATAALSMFALAGLGLMKKKDKVSA
ncbi:MAG: hypothetical protein RLZZ597_2957 [Cyanobacteriota bacterium]|jgi:hypothetical protein